MKKVFLLRHGEAQEEDFESDYARRLTDRGKLRSSILADNLISSRESIEYIITSGAARAKCTADIFFTTFKLNDDMLAVNDEIYTAHDPWLLMDLIWNCSNSISSLLIVGHNPVLSDFAFTLTGKFRSSMEKGSIVKIEFPASRWEDIESSKGNLCFYKTFSSGEIIDVLNIR